MEKCNATVTFPHVWGIARYTHWERSRRRVLYPCRRLYLFCYKQRIDALAQYKRCAHGPHHALLAR